MRILPVAITAVLAVAVAGCATTGPAPVARAGGAALFRQDCAGCHSLTGHNSARRQGGDLLALRVDAPAMLEFVTEMPVRRPLSSQQARTVAAYVLAVEAAHRH